MLVLMTDAERRTATVVRHTGFLLSRVRTKTVCVFEAAREFVPVLSYLGTSCAKREYDRADHSSHFV